MMDEQLKSNLTSSRHWVRLLYMILFALALQVASMVMTVLVVVQFLFALITGNDNDQLRKFGDSLSIFIFDTLQFLIYNSEEKPFPLADWPESTAGKTAGTSVDETDLHESEALKPKAKAKKPAAKKKAAPRKKATPKKSAKEESVEADVAAAGDSEDASDSVDKPDATDKDA